MKGTTNLKPNYPKQSEELKRTKEYILKHFTFYYNNKCPVHKEVKYGISYQPQEPSPDQFKNIKTEEQDYFNKLDKDLMLTYSQKSAKLVMQKRNLYLNSDYNSLYNFNPKKKTFSNTKYTKIKSYTIQAS